ncbi:MAG: hypothetical protein IS860_10660 [Nitrosopumilus sp.]|nr:hypothetical protein [Nitrosopumilus sp.]
MNLFSSFSKNIPFQLRLNNVSDFETIKKIRNYSELGYDSQSDLLRDAVTQFFDSDKTNNLKEEIEKEKLQSLKNKNSLHSIKQRKEDAITRIAEYHADNLGIIGANPSPQARKAMGHHVNATQPYDEDAIYCPDCKFHTNSKDSISWQIDRLTDHVRIFHKRNFTEDEAKIISELLI